MTNSVGTKQNIRHSTSSSPYDFSKTILGNVKGNGEKTKGLGKILSEGSPTLAMGFYPPRVFPRPIPSGNGTPGLIRWYSPTNSGTWGVAIVEN